MLVNSSLSAGALVAVGSEYCGKKEMIKNGSLCISLSLYDWEGKLKGVGKQLSHLVWL